MVQVSYQNWWVQTGVKTAGALNFGFSAMCHQTNPTFFRSLSPKDPHFYQLSPNNPLVWTNYLVTERPWYIFVTKRTLIFAFNSQTSDNFWQKKWIFRKFRQIWRKFEKLLAILAPIYFDAFHWKTPYFFRFVTERPPFLRNLSPKDPLHLICLVALVRHFHIWVTPVKSSFNRH